MVAVPTAPIAPGVRLHAVAITPGVTVYSPPLSKLYVGGAGNVVLTAAGDSASVTLTSVAAGSYVTEVAIANIASGSTATLMVGFY